MGDGPHNRRRHRRRHRHGTRTGTGTPATGRTRTRARARAGAGCAMRGRRRKRRPGEHGRRSVGDRPLPSASNPVGNDIPADAPASEPQHVGGAVEPADLADTIDLTPVGDRDAAMPVREWRRIATTAGGILLAACVTVAGMSAWRSHESATAARELEQATADCATAHAAAKKAEQKLVEYLDGDRSHRRKRSRPTSSPTRKPWKPSTSWPNNIPRASESPHVPPRTRKRPTPPHPSCKPSKRSTREISRG